MADIPILLVLFALLGATLNVLRGYAKADSETFDWRLFSGGLIASTIAAIALIQFVDVTALGPVATAIFGILTGFGGDSLASITKKQ